MSITQTTLYGTGNFFYNTDVQNGVYQNHAFTSPLVWHNAYTAPTPTEDAIISPTVAVGLPHNLFMGSSSGYWVHKLFLNGHQVATYTFADQQFAIPMQFDYVESVALPSNPTEGGVECGRGHGHGGDCPSPSGAAVLLLSALCVRFRARKG
jgi:hypothetical protein